MNGCPFKIHLMRMIRPLFYISVTTLYMDVKLNKIQRRNHDCPIIQVRTTNILMVMIRTHQQLLTF